MRKEPLVQMLVAAATIAAASSCTPLFPWTGRSTKGVGQAPSYSPTVGVATSAMQPTGTIAASTETAPANITPISLVTSWEFPELFDVLWLPDGNAFVAAVWKDPAGETSGVEIFDSATLGGTEFLQTRGAEAIDSSLDGRLLAISQGGGGSILLVDSAPPRLARLMSNVDFRCRAGYFVRFTPYARTLLSADAGDSGVADPPFKTVVSLWDITNERCGSSLIEIAAFATGFELSPSGDLVMVSVSPGLGQPDRFELWEVPGMALRCTLGGSPATFSPSGDTVAFYDRIRHEVGFADSSNCSESRPRFRAEEVDVLAYSPDGTFLAGGGAGISLWSVDTGELVASMASSDGQIDHLVFSPGGDQLLTTTSAFGTRDEVLALWRLSVQ